ncbi:MAG: DUF92 domain-containing protein [Chitinophagaceae bacterium]|nr:MAG: DUF92 domain-containing protein [Chitinophagaceae bacterium]
MPQILFYFIVLTLLVLVAVKSRKLTLAGGVAGGIFAALIFYGVGMAGIALLAIFFILGTMVTSAGKKQKSSIGVTDNPSGTRNVYQVGANGGMAAILGMTAILFPAFSPQILLFISCAFSSATADTVSSELGVLYGKNFRNILNLKPDQRGENGVISVEGFLFGIAGSICIAVVYALFAGFHKTDLIIIIIAGTIGNITDSILGATFERRGLIGNNAVNFLNTLAAVTAGVVMLKFIF